MDLLPTVSIYFDPDAHREDAIKSLMHHLVNLYNKKVYKELSRQVIDFEDPINDDTREFIFKLVPDFTKVYRVSINVI